MIPQHSKYVDGRGVPYPPKMPYVDFIAYIISYKTCTYGHGKCFYVKLDGFLVTIQHF